MRPLPSADAADTPKQAAAAVAIAAGMRRYWLMSGIAPAVREAARPGFAGEMPELNAGSLRFRRCSVARIAPDQFASRRPMADCCDHSNEAAMLSVQDWIALCGLNSREVEAIAEHEHIRHLM